MVNDAQVKGLLRLMSSGTPLVTSAIKSGMCENTARKYSRSGQMPSENRPEHTWRTRIDPFEEIWNTEIKPLLELNNGLEAKAVFQEIQEKYPEKFNPGQLRTLQRRFRKWNALHGKPKEVFFPQNHHPGKLGASDYTEMSSLGITIGSQPFDHLLYHFVLTYSNWEDGTICFSECFESLAEGLQNALWKLGGVPSQHRTDCLSAALNNLSNKREFTRRYTALTQHYHIESQHTNPNSGNENGDIEQRHYRFKCAAEQALLLRGSRDFENRHEYERFLFDLFCKLNKSRLQQLDQEKRHLQPLPENRLPVYTEYKDIYVSNASTIRVRSNIYSVHSRMIGLHVDVRVYADHLDTYFNKTFVEQIPRLLGKGGQRINYRHVIDWFIRKPGAFAEYRYQAEMFPSSNFRIAYDMLREENLRFADKEYLNILYLAATKSEDLTIKALVLLIAKGCIGNHNEVAQLVEWLQQQQSIPPASGSVQDVVLSDYDQLLTLTEVPL